jgi:hypothetical protein
MISFSVNLRNPWSNTFKNLWCKSFSTPFENKFIELECYKDGHLVSFMFNWTVRQSHAGLDLELGLFGYNIHFNFYDNRHWDIEKKAWETHEENLL